MCSDAKAPRGHCVRCSGGLEVWKHRGHLGRFHRLWLNSVRTWQARRRSLQWFPQDGERSLHIRTVRDGWEDHLHDETGGRDPGTWAVGSPDLNSLDSIFPGILKVKVHSVKIRDTSPPRWGIMDSGVLNDGHAVLLTILPGTEHWAALSITHRGQRIQLVTLCHQTDPAGWCPIHILFTMYICLGLQTLWWPWQIPNKTKQNTCLI